MGIFDFVLEAGKKLVGGGSSTPSKPVVRDAAEPMEPQVDRKKAAALVELVSGLGLAVEELSIAVIGQTARVSGAAASQADREKVVLAVGNVEGIQRVDDRMTVAKPEPEATFYTVQRGDTLSKIAEQHYGSAGKYPVIFEANKPMLADPDKIYPGQVLRIPPQGD